ncbi:hypothetical protein LWI29_022087 [Acer saccharum]|uniref:Uncharacterized protein n=1 Tax=Acer saccharum TaxID=4024 RepID=A0AA39S9G7_ACESA|nr:hypothetical protein LWI29_022087 [Acer saccharum]
MGSVGGMGMMLRGQRMGSRESVYRSSLHDHEHTATRATLFHTFKVAHFSGESYYCDAAWDVRLYSLSFCPFHRLSKDAAAW